MLQAAWGPIFLHLRPGPQLAWLDRISGFNVYDLSMVDATYIYLPGKEGKQIQQKLIGFLGLGFDFAPFWVVRGGPPMGPP